MSPILRRSPFGKKWPRDPFYLDIGPGAKIDPAFYNVDYSWRPGINRCCDITKDFNPPKERVLGIYTEHCLEHIPFESTLGILETCYLAMVPGATMRIGMPDLGRYCRAVVDVQSANEADTFDTMIPHQRVTLGLCTPATAINDLMRLHGHLFIWDFNTLERALKRAGFSEVLQCAFRSGKDPKLVRDSAERAYESFYVEATK